ncbi:YfcC family protein [Clostridium sp. MCC353]|uniref:YfcC family protein n=1 Tax=Clostridium sp. MCC353 TaxID=2592646 RepID=UPI0020793F12|nr:Na+/H+ antiporter NhaC family protein [Clostridium sp. MCC353]MBT9776668.1 YfcC family protein [Clostridium sp. MCC353]
MSKEEKAKKGFRMPHTFVIIFIIILAAVLFTWLIPAGEYARFENEQGIKVIDPSQFSLISRSPVNPLFITSYIVNAFIKNADLIMVILFSGGAFHIITQTGALQAVIAKLAKKFSNHIGIFIPLLSLVFALICTTQAVNMFIAFAPVMVMLSLALGLDSICGAAIIILGGAIGFSTGTLNVSTTVISQKIAELPLYSGIGYRFLCFGVFFVVTNLFLIRYANKIRKNPSLSPMYELDSQNAMKANLKLDDFGEMTFRKWLAVVCLVIALVIIVYGSVFKGWDVAEHAAVFMALGIIAGLAAGFKPSQISKEFLAGCKDMLGAAMIIGLARSIGSIMTDGNIIDTVVHTLAGILNVIPFYLQGIGMLIANTIINVFITSGSGQASVVMPIMVPLADLLGMTRQTAILAFNFGDGFCNYVLPTSTALMGIIGAANIPYDKWMKFMWKCFLLWMATGAVMILIAQIIHLGPM